MKKLARLARLALSDVEVELYSGQVPVLLGYFEDLKKVNVTGVEPLVHPLPIEGLLREDEVGESVGLVDCGPDVLNDAFKVPPIL